MSDSSPDRTPASESLGICTSVFGHRHALTAGKIRRLAETGIEWAEIAALQSHHLNVFDAERVEELLAAIAETPLRVWSFHAPFCGLAMDDADTRADGLRKLVQASRVAERFGAGWMVVHPGRDVPSVDREREIGWTRDGLARALDAMPASVGLALETMGRKSLGGPAEEMTAVLAGSDPARVGVCFDTGHVNTGGRLLEHMHDLTGRIVSVHLHDNHGDRDAHDLPGEGNIDWPATLRALREAGYAGPLIGECDSAHLTPIETVLEYVRRMRQHTSGQAP
jgi:sugar phosphate isomerase/epimerase